MNEQKIFPALIFHLKMVANSNLNWHYTFVISIFCQKKSSDYVECSRGRRLKTVIP